MPQSDLFRFFRAWARAPLRVASITPSSPSLSALITREIHSSEGPVLELGPGTGVFTQALKQRGVAERDITLVENGAEFIPLLRRRFPDARLYQMNACDIGGTRLPEGDLFGCVISGLPLLSMRSDTVMRILDGCFFRIRAGGAFYQFTYGLKCPVSAALLERLGLRAERIGWTLRNVPPAAVYRISRSSVGAAGSDGQT